MINNFQNFISEENSFEWGKELIQNLNNICLELKHNDIDFTIEPGLDEDIRIKMLGIYLNGGIQRTPFSVKISTTVSTGTISLLSK